MRKSLRSLSSFILVLALLTGIAAAQMPLPSTPSDLLQSVRQRMEKMQVIIREVEPAYKSIQNFVGDLVSPPPLTPESIGKKREMAFRLKGYVDALELAVTTVSDEYASISELVGRLSGEQKQDVLPEYLRFTAQVAHAQGFVIVQKTNWENIHDCLNQYRPPTP